MRRTIYAFLLIISTGVYLPPAQACDLCGVHQAFHESNFVDGRLRVGVSERLTTLDKIQHSGHFMENAGPEKLESSITQLQGSYDLSDSFGLSLTLPYISRRFRQLGEEEISRGTESGIGDATLLFRVEALRAGEGAQYLALIPYFGLKIPTGDSERLKENHTEAGHSDEMPAMTNASMMRRIVPYHGDEPMSAIHPHDLALGSGSWDFPIGLGVSAGQDRFLVRANLGYTFRTEGDHDYRYADDLTWEVVPSFVAYSEEGKSLSVGLAYSGEHKGKDELAGVKDGDTSITATFLGPVLAYQMGDFSFDGGVHFPANIENSGHQLVPGTRYILGISYSF